MGPSLKHSLLYCLVRGKGLLLPKTLENELFALKVWQNFDQRLKGKKLGMLSCRFELATWSTVEQRPRPLSHPSDDSLKVKQK